MKNVLSNAKRALGRLISFLKGNPRYIFLIAALVTQVLETFGIVVNPHSVEVVLDVVTIIILGRVMKKSEADKII